MMSEDGSETSTDLQQGRACYEQQQWRDAVAALRRAQQSGALNREDLERLAQSAALIGDDGLFLSTLELLYQACTEAKDPRQAASAAFWIGFRLLSVGGSGRASGWLARAQRHIEEQDGECAERGYLLLPTIFRHFGAGDNAAADAAAGEAAEIGERCADADLVAMARNLQGRALLRLGRVDSGLALLDEVMVSVTSGELSPIVTGIVYCNVLTTCQEVYAFDRAREWTASLASWCERQPQLITFTGNCLVHRAEVMQLSGDWRQALEEVRRVCERECQDEDPEVFADACYQQAELFRLRGRLTDAEAAYQLANQNGRDPQPGLALLRLAQGRQAEAVSAIERVMSTTEPAWQRARMLPAFVEIMLAAGTLDKARAGADELARIARDFDTPILKAMAANARGAVRVADGDPRGAIEPLRHAFDVWRRVGAPYITARIRVLLAAAYRALGDRDGAGLELEAARQVFEELNAEPDLQALSGTTAPPSAHGLSPRELEVLRLVASGKTNKAIAARLCISERTVDRHVSNILTKIDAPSRSAATAFAYQHNLV